MKKIDLLELTFLYVVLAYVSTTIQQFPSVSSQPSFWIIMQPLTYDVIESTNQMISFNYVTWEVAR